MLRALLGFALKLVLMPGLAEGPGFALAWSWVERVWPRGDEQLRRGLWTWTWMKVGADEVVDSGALGVAVLRVVGVIDFGPSRQAERRPCFALGGKIRTRALAVVFPAGSTGCPADRGDHRAREMRQRVARPPELVRQQRPIAEQVCAR